MPRSRRSLLRLGGTALATATLAGCLGGGDETDAPAGTATDDAATDSPTPTGTPTTTPTDSPTPTDTPTATPTDTSAVESTDYRVWLPAPSAFDRDHYRFISASVTSILELSSSLGDGAASIGENQFPVPGFDTYADVDAFHQIRGVGTVTKTDVERATVEEAHRSHDRDMAESTYEGYTVFESDGYVGAVGDGAVVTSGAMSLGDVADRRSVVEAFLDARAGTATRYAAANDAADSLFDAVGASQVFQARTHGPDADRGLPGALADATAYYLGETESEIRTPVVFESGGVDESAVADWASDAVVFRDQDPEISVDGRVVTAAATVQSGRIEAFIGNLPGGSNAGGGSNPTPTAAFSFDYAGDGGEGVLTVTHDGGDTIPASELFLRGDGFADVDAAVDQSGPGRWKGSAGGDDDAVVAGDSVDIGVSSDYEIRVVWEAEDGNSAATLATNDGPDA